MYIPCGMVVWGTITTCCKWGRIAQQVPKQPEYFSSFCPTHATWQRKWTFL